MNLLKKRLFLMTIASPLWMALAHAQVLIDWDAGGEDNLWSNALNWSEDNIPDNNGEQARINLPADVTLNVDQNYTINRITDGGAGPGRTLTLNGDGILTIDVNSSTFANSIAIENVTNNPSDRVEGGTLRIGAAKIVIQNSLGPLVVSTIRNTNSTDNVIVFEADSVLTLNSLLRVVVGVGGMIHFNGTLAPSLANLQVASNNVFFGEGHDSADFGADIVLLPNSRLTVNGGTVLNTGRKFQINGSSELILNGAETINGAYVVVGAANNLFIDVNANQSNFGHLLVNNGTLTIDVDAAVTDLSFGSSYFQNWGTGTVAINGFKEGTIRFGTHGAGLKPAQLAAINGGIYSLTDEGYLTTETIHRWGRFAIGENGFATLGPWGGVVAYVETAPFIGSEETGWLYIDELVAVRGAGWVYAYEPEALMVAETDEPGIGYSFVLNRWVFLPEADAEAVGRWVLVL